MPITSVLQFHVASDRVAEAQAAITETLVATRAFDGCLGVDVLVDVADPTYFVLLERWQSLEHDDAYRAWRETHPGSFGSFVTGTPQLNRLSTITGA